MHARLRLRPIAAALCLGAALAGTAQAGPAEDELWACTAELMRQTPSWRAMRDARIEMQQKGFRVISKQQEGYLDKHGRTVIAYGFQIAGDNKAHSIRCTEDMFRAAAPAVAPGAQPTGRRAKVKQAKRAKPTSVAGQQASPSAVAQ